MSRYRNPASTIARLLVSCALLATPALAAAGPGGGPGDEELDERIETAMLGVRADRPWRVPGSAPVCSQDPTTHPPFGTACCGSSWTFSFTPYLWIPAVHGTLSAKGQEVDVDESVGDTASALFSDLEFALLGQFEARNCDWSFMFNGIYLNLGSEGTVDSAAAGPVDVSSDFKMALAEVYVGYRFASLPLGCRQRCFRPEVWLEAQAGARVIYVGLEIDLDPGATQSGSRTWVDPVVGLRSIFHVTPRLSFDLRANIGGFGLGSDLSWNVVAGASYKIARCVDIAGGWAILDERYQKGAFEYDIQLSGPYLGVTFRF